MIRRVGRTTQISSLPAPDLVLVALAVCGCLAAFTNPSPLATLTMFGCLITILWCLRNLPEAAVFLVPTIFQFMQVAVKPITSLLLMEPLNDMADYGSDIESAAIFGFLSLGLLACGLRLGSMTAWRRQRRLLYAQEPLNIKMAQRIAILLLMAGSLIDLVAVQFGVLRAVGITLANIKFAGIFLLALLAAKYRVGRPLFLLVVAIDIVGGMTGFFGDFRYTIFAVFAGLVAAGKRPSFNYVIIGTTFAAIALLLAVFWSHIKGDYRDFLNRGTGAQVVLVSTEARLHFLAEATLNFNTSQFADGFERLVSRLSYIDFLAATVEHVPARLPHENGHRVIAAVQHILTPRVLFPDKPALESDTAVTEHYTGLTLRLRNSTNTSISIGYLGELYIDFGKLGTLFAMFVAGFAIALMVHLINNYRALQFSLNLALSVVPLFAFAAFGVSLTKAIGGIVTALLIVIVIQRLISRFLYRAHKRQPVLPDTNPARPHS